MWVRARDGACDASALGGDGCVSWRRAAEPVLRATLDDDTESTPYTAPTFGRVAFLAGISVSIEDHFVVNECNCEDVVFACIECFRQAFDKDGR